MNVNGTPSDELTGEYHQRLDDAIDAVLDVIMDADAAGVEVDPLDTIQRRLAARGHEIDLEQLPPLMRMLLGGMQ